MLDRCGGCSYKGDISNINSQSKTMFKEFTDKLKVQFEDEYKEGMTTEEIVKLVQGYGDDADGAKAELKRLVRDGVLTISAIRDALGEKSKAYPCGWLNAGGKLRVFPEPFTVFLTELYRENGFPGMMCC